MAILTPHQKSAIEFPDHLSLTANAGSGKTFVLARRYLKAALKEGVNISNIAAVTFTDKAAGELYNKIIKLVQDEIKASLSESETKKLEKIRRQLVSANISTIHSFCINILKEFPVEARLDARFVPIDEQLSDELIELSVEESVQKLLNDVNYSEKLKYLIRIFGSKNRLVTELFSLIKKRKNLFTIKENIYSKNEEEITKYIQKQFDIFFSKVWKNYENDLIEGIKKINNTVLLRNTDNLTALKIASYLKKNERFTSSNQILRFINEIKSELLTSSGTVRIQGYLPNNLRESLTKEIKIVEASLSELIKIEFSEEQKKLLEDLVRFGKILIEIFDYTLSKYETKKSSEGFLDYEDILFYTKEILKKPDVQKSLNEKFKYILVDEYQDTNEIQYEIFLPILDYLKTGNLFIVGDEKQSIYMFRDAELEIFNKTKKDISSVSGDKSLLELPDSFRMAPAICLFANKLFENLFANPNELFNEVANSNIVCARADGKPGKIEFLLSDPADDNSASEAEMLARRILELNSNGIDYKNIAILVRKRKSFADLETKFINHKIPFTIIGGRGFYQRQTISDIYNYLLFLSNSSNSSALAGVLRSPFFTISDAILFEISLKPGTSYWEKFKQSSLESEKLNRIKELLEENIQLASSVDLTVLIRKILTDTDYLAIIATRDDGRQELANISKLLDISRGFSLKGYRNLYDFLDYLNESITESEDEPQADIPYDTNAVQLMTLHQAKGLEFPVVILYNTHEASKKTQTKSKQITISKKFGILTKLPLNDNYLTDYQSSPIIGLYNFIEEKKNIAEIKRLLYVGVTRAIDHLIISGEFNKEQVLKKDSFLYLIQYGLGIDFQSNKFVIEDELQFLKQKEGKYFNSTQKIKIIVPIKNKVSFEQSKKFISEAKKEKSIVNIDKIPSTLGKDIISATKVAVYHQCPTKYLLTYEYGFGRINSLIKNSLKTDSKIEIDYPENEDNNSDQLELSIIKSSLKGLLVHSLLEKEIVSEKLSDEITRYFAKNGLSEKQLTDSKNKIISEIKRFFDSDIFKHLQSFQNYLNEFEAYIKDEGIYLYGNMDKIIFSEDTVTIVDYKTDNIEEIEIEERAANYQIQLNFYIYIAQKLFNSYNSFQTILIFIKHPEFPVIKNYNKQDIFLVKKEISDIIKGIIHKKFYKNTNHCKVCVYSDKLKKCILN